MVAIMIRILYFLFRTFFEMNNISKPVPSSKIPATIKSKIFHLTSFVNCIAIKGIINILQEIKTMISTLLSLSNLFKLPKSNKLYLDNCPQMGYNLHIISLKKGEDDQ